MKGGRDPFHSSNFSERTIGTSGNVSECSPDLFDLSGKTFTAPTNVKSSYAHILKPNLVRDTIERAPTALKSKRVQRFSAWEQKPGLLSKACEPSP